MRLVALCAFIVFLALPMAASAYDPVPFGMEEEFKQEAEERRRAEQDASSAARLAEDIRRRNELGESFLLPTEGDPDYVEAFFWYRSAAELGDVAAQYYTARIFDIGGFGITQDIFKATRLFQEAAKKGYAPAQFSLAVRYAEDPSDFNPDPATRGGIMPDNKRAAELYRNAAEQGLVIAQRNLGIAYEAGRGVPQNWEEAYFWYRLFYTASVEMKSPGAIANSRHAVEDAEKHLTSAQIGEIKKKAEAWGPIVRIPFEEGQP